MKEVEGSLEPRPRSSNSVTWMEKRGRCKQANEQRMHGKNDMEVQRKQRSVRKKKRRGQQRWPAPTACETSTLRTRGSSPMLKRQSMSLNVHKGKRQGTKKAKRIVWATTRQKTRTASETRE